MVTFVNTTNEAQVFATSETFEIADGEGSYSKITIKEKLMGFPSDELYYDCFFHHYHFFLFGLHPKQQDIYFFLVRGSFLGFCLRTC